MTERQQKLSRFYNDPEWYLVEEEILSFIEPLVDIFSVDVESSPEDVKAQVMSRRVAYTQLTDFLRASKLLKEKEQKSQENPYR